MRLWWCLCGGALVLAGCAGYSRPPSIDPASPTTQLRVETERGPARRVGLEEYVRGTILSEFNPPSGEPALVERMFEVQAIISRTYAVSHLGRHARQGFDLCATTHCQLFDPGRLKSSRWARQVYRATASTTGMVLWHGGAPARTLFHADCGGHTSAVTDVWEGMSSPYLRAHPDDGPADAAHSTWRFAIETAAFAAALNADARTRIGREVLELRIADRDAAGRAARVSIKGSREVLVRGEELRAVITRRFGPGALRSTKFTVERSGGQFVFAGRGYGHGVGLCQTGAYARLTAGSRPAEVLARYYPGTRLRRLR